MFEKQFNEISHGQPTVMNVMAQAVWNDEKQAWEVSVVFNENRHTLQGDYICHQSSNKYLVDDCCDEYVLSTAIEYHLGIADNDMNHYIKECED